MAQQLTREQANQLASWFKDEGLCDYEVPPTSLNLQDPMTWSKVSCAITGCDVRGNALRLEATGKTDVEGNPIKESAMWYLTLEAWSDRNERQEQKIVPLCRFHANCALALLHRKSPKTPTVLLPVQPLRPLALGKLRAKSAAAISGDDAPGTAKPTRMPKKSEHTAELVANFIYFVTIFLKENTELPEDELTYGEAYLEYDQLMQGGRAG